jgi:DNA polymerase I-like protein with 3'-5' exonuclease and polymerase domains
LRQTIAKMRLTGLTIGQDGRNRCLLSPFRSISGRNQPSNSKFIFGPAAWMRNLICPPPGHGLAYCDWSAQEFAIVAALSGDQAMIDSYTSGDPHWAFAVTAGLVDKEDAAADHPEIRNRCKATNLGVNYGMASAGLALRLGITRAEAQELLRRHRETYRRFWAWADATVSSAMLTGVITTVFGWPLHIADAGINPRTIQNFPAQGNGSEAMRLAAIAATEAGIEVCAPVHDAFLLCAPGDRLDEHVATMREIMRLASMKVTGGLPIRTDAKLIRPGERYATARGAAMWRQIQNLLDEDDTA